MIPPLIHIRQAKGGTLCGQQGKSVTVRWRTRVTCEHCKAAYARLSRPPTTFGW